MQVNPRLLGKKQYTLPAPPPHKHKLDIIENQYPAHSSVIAAAVPRSFNLYPTDESEPLKRRIAGRNGCSADQIILTNGSDNALGLLVHAYGVGRIVAPVPTYPHFLSFARMNGNLCTVDFGTRAPTVRELVAAAVDASLLYLVSPNLPLGYVLDVDFVDAVADALPTTMVVVDEAYVEFGGVSHVGLTARHNVTVVRTFSKAYGLAGLRIGYLISHADNIAIMRAAVNEKSVTVHAISAALAALNAQEHYDQCVRVSEAEKARINERLALICFDPAPIYARNCAGGNFYLMFAREPARVVAAFAREGILIRDKSDEIPGAIRVAVGRPEQNDCVLDMVARINRVEIMRKYATIFDVDGTLCHGSKHTALAPGAREVVAICAEPIVVTNNCTFSHDQLREFTGINAVYTPLDFIQNAAVIGRDDITDSRAVVLAANHFIDIATAAKISEAGLRGATLYYPTSGRYIDFDNCSDLPDTGSTLMPDIGAVARMFAGIMPVVQIGKPHCALPPSSRAIIFMIGDSQTDEEYAHAHGLVFLRTEADLRWILEDW